MTIHRSLRRVPDAITLRGGGARGAAPPSRAAGLGATSRRIAVCGLNPHAGEGGCSGGEEIEVIAPAVARLRKEGLDVSGPFPRTACSRGPRAASSTPCSPSYHDQGLIPVKLAAFGHAVNVTIGLPFVRTSVDHGTGFDIVERGRAWRTTGRACSPAMRHERTVTGRTGRRGARRYSAAGAPARTAWRVSRSMSLRLMDSRLSCDFLPRASPISTLTFPFLK